MGNIQHASNWFGNYYTDSSGLVVTSIEPPVRKEKSIKVMARISGVINGGHYIPATGKIILYLDHGIPMGMLQYGSKFFFNKKIQEIRNSGNPGAFDYRRYCMFQGITHQLFLRGHEFVRLPETSKQAFHSFIFSLKHQILLILKKNIKGEKETGLAEALLVGYRDDLDKSLVQSYSNTGVVHIIAISGLHLGLIYWLLVTLCKPLSGKRRSNWLATLLIITGLWLFSILAGAQPSVLRSALMFSCIALGEGLNRKTNIYNSLALSAFVLLCYHPFWLWDTGFQLSYAAVLSLVIFMRAINKVVYFRHKLLNGIWKLNAVTLAAQILTLPLCVYYFHQLPLCFLLTNLVAVPLSSIILMGEIALVAISFTPVPASLIGLTLSWLTKCMNGFVQEIDKLSFSTWRGLQINLCQTVILFLLIIAFSYWIMKRKPSALKAGLICVFAFLFLRSISFIASSRQKRLIVYNVPQRKAVDLIEGRRYQFIGDSSLLTEISGNFHLNPARTLLRATAPAPIAVVGPTTPCLSWQGKHILFLDTSLAFKPTVRKPVIDILVLSGNARFMFKNLAQVLTIKQVVADGTIPHWKAATWKKDCEQLLIPWHDVSEKGAFVINLR